MDDKKILWDSSYSLGIRTIDNQHKKLFNLVNKLYDLQDETATKEEIRTILYDFSDYMKTHFRDEEEYMQSIEYDKIEEHKQKHKELVENLAQIIKTPATLSIIKSKMKIIAKRTLLGHIIKEDTKIKLFQENIDMHKDISFNMLDINSEN